MQQGFKSGMLAWLVVALGPLAGCATWHDPQPVAYVAAPPPELHEQAQLVPLDDDVELAAYEDTDPSALHDFEEPLAPYGSWVDDPNYGTLWVPHEHVVGADFVPYQTAGHWAYDDDYVWVSDYSWGWIPFHYGRWVLLPNQGWGWIPGRTYAGAWVTWRSAPGYGYVGWAPMPPTWYWYGGHAVPLTMGLWITPRYHYCHTDALFSRNVHTHVVRGQDARVHDARTAAYTPAKPTVNGSGGRTAASPSVNDRTAASPSVNDRTAASPSVNDRTAAKPGLDSAAAHLDRRGPSPASLGIDESRVKPVDRASSGVARAQNFAQPATAMQLGARAPMASNGGVGSRASQASSKTLGGEGSHSTSALQGRPSLLMPPPAMLPPRYTTQPVGTGPRSLGDVAGPAAISRSMSPQASGARTDSPSGPNTVQIPNAPSYASSAISAETSRLTAPSSSTFRSSAPSYSSSSSRVGSSAPSYSAPSSRVSSSASRVGSSAPSYSSSSSRSSPSSVSHPGFSGRSSPSNWSSSRSSPSVRSSVGSSSSSSSSSSSRSWSSSASSSASKVSSSSRSSGGSSRSSGGSRGGSSRGGR